jgi:RNA polymerase sigma factor (sigma-70 family)
MNAALDALARRAQEGDRDALEALVRGLQAQTYRLALRMLGAPEPARDATQEILILIITQLSRFRGESAVTTWAYRVAVRYLLREKKRTALWTFEALAEDLGQAPNEIDRAALRVAEQKLLEEEVFVGCTQAMLQSLDPTLRIAFVLGAICELEAPECAAILGTTSAAFRKRLSRARAALDAFLTRHCGVANQQRRCRCASQVNLNLRRGRIDPEHLRYAVSPRRTSLQVLQAYDEVNRVRDSIELYRAQPPFDPPEDFSAQVRELLASTSVLSGRSDA